MIRKPLFFGLTLVLVAALVYLVIQGRKLEKAKAKKGVVEIVRESPGTPVRLLSPTEISVIDGGVGRALQVRNSGTVAFKKAVLSVTFLDRNGARLGSSEVAVAEPLAPGQTVTLAGPDAAAVPKGTVRRTARVLYAELGKSTSGQ